MEYGYFESWISQKNTAYDDEMMRLVPSCCSPSSLVDTLDFDLDLLDCQVPSPNSPPSPFSLASPTMFSPHHDDKTDSLSHHQPHKHHHQSVAAGVGQQQQFCAQGGRSTGHHGKSCSAAVAAIPTSVTTASSTLIPATARQQQTQQHGAKEQAGDFRSKTVGYGHQALSGGAEQMVKAAGCLPYSIEQRRQFGGVAAMQRTARSERSSSSNSSSADNSSINLEKSILEFSELQDRIKKEQEVLLDSSLDSIDLVNQASFMLGSSSSGSARQLPSGSLLIPEAAMSASPATSSSSFTRELDGVTYGETLVKINQQPCSSQQAKGRKIFCEPPPPYPAADAKKIKQEPGIITAVATNSSSTATLLASSISGGAVMTTAASSNLLKRFLSENPAVREPQNSASAVAEAIVKHESGSLEAVGRLPNKARPIGDIEGSTNLKAPEVAVASSSSPGNVVDAIRMEPMLDMAMKQVKKDIDTTCEMLSIAKNPKEWSKEDVRSWLLWTVQQFSIPMSMLDLDQWDLTGDELAQLREIDFTHRLPQGGDTLYAQYDLWRSFTMLEGGGQQPTVGDFSQANSSNNNNAGGQHYGSRGADSTEMILGSSAPELPPPPYPGCVSTSQQAEPFADINMMMFDMFETPTLPTSSHHQEQNNIINNNQVFSTVATNTSLGYSMSTVTSCQQPTPAFFSMASSPPSSSSTEAGGAVQPYIKVEKMDDPLASPLASPLGGNTSNSGLMVDIKPNILGLQQQQHQQPSPSSFFGHCSVGNTTSSSLSFISSQPPPPAYPNVSSQPPLMVAADSVVSQHQQQHLAAGVTMTGGASGPISSWTHPMPSSEPIAMEEDDDSDDEAEKESPVSGRTTTNIHLWQFVKELLLQPQQYANYIHWVDRSRGIFKIVDSVKVATLWGKRKNRPAMNYDKLSRSLRQYYKKGIMKKTERSQRLVYQFCHPYYL